MNKVLAKALVRDMSRVSDYVPGRSVEEVCASFGMDPAAVSKNASNENPLGPSPAAVETVGQNACAVHVYPEGVSRELARRVAGLRGVEPGQVVFGNGSDEVLDFVMKLFVAPGDELVIPDCTFQMYALLAEIYGARAVRVPLRELRLDLDAMLAAVTPATKVVFVCNPNNPTGDFYPQAEIAEFLRRLPEGVVAVVDEAYGEFAPGLPADGAAGLIAAHALTVVTRTFSKLYGLAGLRIGYGVMDAELAGCMLKIRPPFNNSTLAQAAAIAALDDREYIDASLKLVEDGRGFLYAGLDRLGCEYVRTGANFICVRTGREAAAVCESFIRGGIILRSLEAFGMPDFIRYTIGTSETNGKFLELLGAVLEG